MKYLLISYIILFTSCSAQWHLAKALQKDPTIIVTDTIITYDTVWNEVEVVDTVFQETYDTVQLTLPGEVKVRYSRDTINNEIFLEVDCPDCPEVTKTITPPTIIMDPPWLAEAKKKKKWFWIGGILLLILIAAGIVIKIIKPL